LGRTGERKGRVRDAAPVAGVREFVTSTVGEIADVADAAAVVVVVVVVVVALTVA
jgi:hypothetical protein